MTNPSNITPSPAMSESFNGVDPGMNGRENTRFPTGTMTVEAMNNTLAEPNLCSREARGREQQNGVVLVAFPSNNSGGVVRAPPSTQCTQ